MAETRGKLQELTECSICLKGFTDPRMLPCIHTFCLGCLKELCSGEMHLPPTHLSCPLCCKGFAIPVGGVDELQKNFFLQNLMEITTNLQLDNMSIIACDICKNLYEGDEKTKAATMRCLECKDNFCDLCAKAHTLQKLSRNHHILEIGSETEYNVIRMLPSSNCIVHSHKPLDYYCPQCKKVVCISCLLEEHISHGCKDVRTVEDEFRQAIERNALKISIYADEMLSKAKNVEQRKETVLLKLAQIGGEIQHRNLELKKLIDQHTVSLMDQLSLITQEQINDFDKETENINQIHTILKSFENYSTELRLKGSASDICSSVNALITRSDELEEDHEKFIGLPYWLKEISFEATDLGEIVNTWRSDIFGRIQGTYSQVEICVIITGLCDGQSLTNDVLNINLHRSQEISIHHQIPTKMQYGSAAAVYRNTLYVTGIGERFDEIWYYNLDSGWMKCASLVQGRSEHCAEFVDETLYICGGYVLSNGSVLDSVEAYDAVANTCRTVGKLIHHVSHSGNCVPFRSSLYIFGGIDKDHATLNHVQVYNTKQNTCTLLSKAMPHGFNLMQAVLWETSVILLGCDTCFIFNFETETWQERKQFKTDVVHFGLALENGRVFVIGGGIHETDEPGTLKWTCRDDVRYVPLQSVINDKPAEWKSYAKLAKPVLIHAYWKIPVLLPDSDDDVPLTSFMESVVTASKA